MDGAKWPMLRGDKNSIDLENHEEFQAKTDESQSSVAVDAVCMKELLSLKGSAETDYVVEGDTPFVHGRSSQYYRADRSFKRAIAWLRAHGVNGDKPLHTLRKEFGSIICELDGIHAASEQLRNTNIATTAGFYVENRRRAVVPIGKFVPQEVSGSPLQSLCYEI